MDHKTAENGWKRCKIRGHLRHESEWRPGGHSCEECYRSNVRAQQKYRAKNLEKCKARDRDRYLKDPETNAARSLRYYREHRAERLAYNADRPSGSQLVYSAKWRAKKDGVPFDLNASDFRIPEVCPALGLLLVMGDGQPTDASPTLDRLIPSLGYVRGNVYVISARANRLKGDGTAEELERIAAYIRQNQPKSRLV